MLHLDLGTALQVLQSSSVKGWVTEDRAITFVVLLGISIPSFFLGMMMILLFAVNLRMFPVSGMWPIYGARDLSALVSHLTLPATRLSGEILAQGNELRFEGWSYVEQCSIDDAVLVGLAEFRDPLQLPQIRSGITSACRSRNLFEWISVALCSGSRRQSRTCRQCRIRRPVAALSVAGCLRRRRCGETCI